MLTLQRLKERLSYNPDSGIFTWRQSPAKRVKIGDVAGTKCNGYIRIFIDSKGYAAHRLAWFYVYGEWPSHQIDHINRLKDDNKISNLRDISIRENAENRLHQINSKSKQKGVSWIERDKKWAAKIMANGKEFYLGAFKDMEHAIVAYETAAKIVHSYNPSARAMS